MDALFRNLRYLTKLTTFNVASRPVYNCQFSDVVIDCLHALDKSVPDSTLGEFIQIRVVDTRKDIESICQAASQHIPNAESNNVRVEPLMLESNSE